MEIGTTAATEMETEMNKLENELRHVAISLTIVGVQKSTDM